MGVNARIGGNIYEHQPSKRALGAYGCDKLKDKRSLLLRFAETTKLTPTNTFIFKYT